MFKYFKSGFLRGLLDNVELKDILLIFSIPIVLIIVFFLPQGIQENLVLNFNNPYIPNLFSTVLVHANLGHLINNLTSYLIFIIPLYMMCVLTGLKRKFRYLFLGFVFLLPVILSIINLNFLDVETSRGFSGVVSAFLGCLGVTSFYYLDKIFKLKTKKPHLKTHSIFSSLKFNSIILLLYGSAIIVLVYTGISLTFIAISILILTYFFMILYSIKWKTLKKSIKKKGYLELFIFSILIFILSIPGLFPRDVGGVNILSHYSGFVIGFFITYISIN